MALINSPTPALHPRQNRRRKRPGSQTRRTISRKCNFHYDCNERCPDGRDFNALLPPSQANPRPLLREVPDQCWQRWNLRQAAEGAQAEMDILQLEQERQRLFGGDGDDDGSLCLAMLDVMMRLFGDIDYTDP